MVDLKAAIRTAIKEERREFLATGVRTLRFAYAEGVDTLYKFKSLAGESRDHVRDMIQNSRLYFSTQDELNDPDDCRPVFKLGGDPADPAFAAELRKDEEEMIREMNLTPEAEAHLRAMQGTRVEDMAAAITRNVRAEILRTLRIFCFSATKDNSQLWAYYANSHKGVCLHFHVASGELTGLSRGVDYEPSVPPVLVPLRYNPGNPDFEAARRMSLVKPQGWRHEAEYRIMANPEVDWGHPMNGRYVSFPPEHLTGITLGLKISPQDRADVLTWAAARKPPLPVWEAYENPSTFIREYRQVA
jgi:hypothetical protein